MPPASRPAPRVVEKRPAKVGAAKPAPAASVTRPFRLAWHQPTHPFVTAIALSSRHVAVLGDRTITLLELRGGNPVKRTAVCEDAIGLDFAGDDAIEVVCGNTLKVFSVPALEAGADRPLPGKARVATLTSSFAALAFEAGPVRLYRRNPKGAWDNLGEMDAGATVRSLAVTGDGSLLGIGREEGDVVLLDLAGNTAHRLEVKTGLPVDALSFDGAGKHFFAAAGPSATTWSVPGRSLARRFATVSKVHAACWVSDTEIVSAGRDGLLLLGTASGAAVNSMPAGLDGTEPPVVLGSAPDGSVVCSAERSGKVACFSRGSIPSRAIPTADFGADQMRMAGRVASHVPPRLVIHGAATDVLPKAGTVLRVFRYAETQVLTETSTRWVEVSKGTVIKVKDGLVHLEERDPVAPPIGKRPEVVFGDAVRLVWKRPDGGAPAGKPATSAPPTPAPAPSPADPAKNDTP